MKTVLFFAMLLKSSYADFWKEGNGWVYNDHGDHKARTHVLDALSEARDTLYELKANAEHDLGQKATEALVRRQVRFLDFLIDPIKDTAHHISYKYAVSLAMQKAGIGEEESKCWAELCAKKHNGDNDVIHGVEREISWITSSDPDRGIWLHFTKGQWHCDHR